MIHQFSHTFSDKETLTLAVDMSQSPPTFVAHPTDAAARHSHEYGIWLHKVIVPALVELASMEQMGGFAEKGARVFAKTMAREGSL